MADEAGVMCCFFSSSRCLRWVTVFILATSLARSAQLLVNWDDNATGESGFKIERSVDGVNFTQIGTVSADVTTYADTTVVGGATYSYRVAAFNATTTSGYSNVAKATVPAAATAPAFLTQPVGQSVNAGSSVAFSVSATGSPAPAFQWTKGGVALPGATASTLAFSAAQMSDAGTYAVTISNSAGSVTSNAAILIINSAPAFTQQPVGQSVAVGGGATFSVGVTGSPKPSLQWRKDGVALVGATANTLNVSNVTASSAGAYSVIASNSVGAITSVSAMLSVTSSSVVMPGKIAGVSARAVSAPWGSAALQLSFTIARGSKTTLLRAVGPGLSAYTTDAVFPDPVLQLSGGSGVIASNDNWGGTALLADSFSRVGAFTLPAGSKDAAILGLLAANNYTATISGKAGGSALAEIYDADADSTLSGRLSRVTARGTAGRGTAALTVGFVIGGDAPLHVLIRAIGPSLTGLQGVLANPRVDLYRGQSLVAQNDNWGGTAALTTLFQMANAAKLSPKSKDAALDVTLAPGVYSAVVSGVNSSTGLTQFEIYELP